MQHCDVRGSIYSDSLPLVCLLLIFSPIPLWILSVNHSPQTLRLDSPASHCDMAMQLWNTVCGDTVRALTTPQFPANTAIHLNVTGGENACAALRILKVWKPRVQYSRTLLCIHVHSPKCMGMMDASGWAQMPLNELAGIEQAKAPSCLPSLSRCLRKRPYINMSRNNILDILQFTPFVTNTSSQLAPCDNCRGWLRDCWRHPA
jgi:hypothetical protein